MADEDKPIDRTDESNEDGADGGDVDSGSTDSSTDDASDLFGDEGSPSSPTDEEPSSDSFGDEESSDAFTDVGSSDVESSGSTIDVEVTRPESGTGTTSGSSDSTTDEVQGASPAEEAALKRVRAVSQLLDEAFRIPGTNYRIGLDPILGILPVAGDAIPTILSFYPIVEAYRVGVPNRMLAKMFALVAIDATVGSIPVIGTLFDAVWKANKWNLRMLERYIEQG